MDFDLLSRRNFLKVSTILTVGAITPSALGTLVNPGPSILTPGSCVIKRGEPYIFRMGDGFDANGVQIWQEMEVTPCDAVACVGNYDLCGKMPKMGDDGKIKRGANGQMLLFDVAVQCAYDPDEWVPICLVNT